MTKLPIVEISDILNDGSLVGKLVEVRDVVVTEYERGQIQENDTIPYNGEVEKDGVRIKFEGVEDDIGIDVTFIHSWKYGHKLKIEGDILKDRSGNKYISVNDVDWI